MASNKNLYGGYSKNSLGQHNGYSPGASQPISPDSPSDGRFNPYDLIHQYNYNTGKRGQAQYAEDLARLQYLAGLAQQDWQNAYNEARVADERAYQEKITADNRAYNERMIAEDREYNSYANQVKLMKEAGLNPDLLGVSLGNSQTPIASGQSVGSNSSVSGPNVASNPMSGIPTTLDTFGDVLSVIGSVTSIATGLMSGGLSLANSAVNNTDSAIALADSATQFFDKFGHGDMSETGTEFITSMPFLSRSQKKRLKKQYETYRSNSRHSDIGLSKFETEVMEATGNFYKHAVDPRYNSDSSQIYYDAWKPLIDAYNEHAIKKLKSESNKFDYDSHVYNSQTGYSQYLSEQARRRKDTQYDTEDYWLREPLIKTLNNMKSREKKYPWLGWTRTALSGYILKRWF